MAETKDFFEKIVDMGWGVGTRTILVQICHKGVIYMMTEGTQVGKTNRNTYKNRDPWGSR